MTDAGPHQAKVPEVAEHYSELVRVVSREHQPVVRAQFPARRIDGSLGWASQTYCKRISRSWVRKLRAAGITHVQLGDGRGSAGSEVPRTRGILGLVVTRTRGVLVRFTRER